MKKALLKKAKNKELAGFEYGVIIMLSYMVV